MENKKHKKVPGPFKQAGIAKEEKTIVTLEKRKRKKGTRDTSLKIPQISVSNDSFENKLSEAQITNQDNKITNREDKITNQEAEKK